MSHVLYAFDGPKMVLAQDARGRQVLGIAADEDADGSTRWLFAPAPPERVVALLKTRQGLRVLFEVGPVDIHDVSSAWESQRAWLSVTSVDVPEELFPESDAELPELTDEMRELLLDEQARFVEQRRRVGRTKMLFSGGPVRDRRGISAGFAAEALSGYQALVSLAYGSRRRGDLRRTGPIPERGGSTLMLADMPRGSVGFELVEDIEQASVVPTELAETISQVGGLLDAAASSDAAYAEAVAELSPRVVGAMHAFLQKLRGANATMKLDVQNREYDFTRERIDEAFDRTSSEPTEEAARPVTGRLVGYLPTDRRFELEVEGRLIKGKVARDADVARISSFFTKACTAHLDVVIVERRGHTTEAFTLVSVGEPLSG